MDARGPSEWDGSHCGGARRLRRRGGQLTAAPRPASPVRVFWADTPHDVACAALVAGELPAGDDVLLVSPDKAHADVEDYRRCLEAMAATHPWAAVVDASGLPVTTRWIVRGARRHARLLAGRDRARTVRRLRELLGEALGVPAGGDLTAAVDEAYLTCLHHPDVQALYTALPHARKSYAPHGFDCLQETEISLYAPWVEGPRTAGARLRNLCVDTALRLAFGPHAPPPRGMRLDQVYSFNLASPWTTRTERLAHRLTRESMEALYAGLAEDARRYVDEVARRCTPGAALLLLPPDDERLGAGQDELLAGGVVELSDGLVNREQSGQLVVKPHPRNSPDWVERVCAQIREELPSTELLLVSRYSSLPIEVVSSRLSLVACASMGSTAMRTLNRLYGMRAYCSEPLLRRLCSGTPREAAANEAWIRGNRDWYIRL